MKMDYDSLIDYKNNRASYMPSGISNMERLYSQSNASNLYTQANGGKYLTNQMMENKKEEDYSLELHKQHAKNAILTKNTIQELKNNIEEEKVKTKSLSEEIDKFNIYKENN